MFTCADRTAEAEPHRTPKATEPGRQTGAPNIGDVFLHEDKDRGFYESLVLFCFLLCLNAGEQLICWLLLTYLRRAGWLGGGGAGNWINQRFTVILGRREEEDPSLQILIPWPQEYVEPFNKNK